MGKTRNLFKKTRDTKGTFHAKMGSIMDLTEAEDIGGKNTQKNYIKKILMTQITTIVWSLHLEPDILECEVKWALGSVTMNKDSGGDGIPGELFKILKDDALQVLLSVCQQI